MIYLTTTMGKAVKPQKEGAGNLLYVFKVQRRAFRKLLSSVMSHGRKDWNL